MKATFLETLNRPAFGILPVGHEVSVTPPRVLEPWRIPRFGQPDCFDLVIKIVSAAFHLTQEQLLSRIRTAKIAWARQVAMSLYYEISGESSAEVGRRFGRDHSVILYADKLVFDTMSVYPKLAAAVSALEARIVAAMKEEKP